VIIGILRTLLVSVGIACLTNYALEAIGSRYLLDFLKANIINIQIGLLAINTATLGVVLTKLRDLVDKGVPLEKFSSARREMLLSVKEQVALIIAVIVILSLDGATLLKSIVPSGLLHILLLSCFAYALMVLYDTAKSVFVVLGDSSES
jgi:hypothetical protein